MLMLHLMKSKLSKEVNQLQSPKIRGSPAYNQGEGEWGVHFKVS